MKRRHALQWLAAASPLSAPALLAGCGGGSSDSAATPNAPAGPVQLSPAQASYHHGDAITVANAGGNPQVTHTFLGGAGGRIESRAAGQTVLNGDGWTFHEVGYPTTIAQDATRGKVLYNTEDDTHYDATRRFDTGAVVAEQRYFYNAHWARCVLTLGGAPFTRSFQWKHLRLTWHNNINDSDCEVKFYDWPQGGNGQTTHVNRVGNDRSTYYGGHSVRANTDWALIEMLVYTGSVGQTNGKLITRVHHNGRTYVNQSRQNEGIYVDPTLRLRHFFEQNYLGSFSQVEDGPNNATPKPDVREIYSDDSRIIVGQDASSGWQRVELRDTASLQTATVRELQTWSSWNGHIALTLNTGGLPSGTHDLFLVVIDGVDVNGWDVVRHALPLRVVV